MEANARTAFIRIMISLVAEYQKIFENGVCLPGDTKLGDDLYRITDIIKACGSRKYKKKPNIQEVHKTSNGLHTFIISNHNIVAFIAYNSYFGKGKAGKTGFVQARAPWP